MIWALSIWAMVGFQMLAWLIFSLKGGKLADKPFLWFTAGMMIGQIGAGIETYFSNAWATLAVQMYFFIFTFIGGINRIRQMRSWESNAGGV